MRLTLWRTPEAGSSYPYYGVRGEFGWVGFLAVCFPYKIIQTHEKMFAVGKSGPNATFDLFFAVGDFRQFQNIIYVFSKLLITESAYKLRFLPNSVCASSRPRCISATRFGRPLALERQEIDRGRGQYLD